MKAIPKINTDDVSYYRDVQKMNTDNEGYSIDAKEINTNIFFNLCSSYWPLCLACTYQC